MLQSHSDYGSSDTKSGTDAQDRKCSEGIPALDGHQGAPQGKYGEKSCCNGGPRHWSPDTYQVRYLMDVGAVCAGFRGGGFAGPQ